MRLPVPWLAAVFCVVAAIAQTGVITTVAGTIAPDGTGVRGYGGDDGPAVRATIALANVQNECDPNRYEQTVHISTDPAGNIYFADSNNQRIRRIDTQGVITTIAGAGTRPSRNSLCEPTGSINDGPDARAALLYNPADVVPVAGGGFIISDQQNNRIRQVASNGAIATVAGNGLHNLYAPGIPATSSPMDWPSAVAVDASGVIYFAELHGNRVAKIGSDRRLTTVAGTGFPGYNGDRIQAATAMLRKPAGLALDAAGNLYIADEANHRVRKVAPNGLITTVAGTGQANFSGDNGPAESAALNTPMDVKLDSRGNIFIADTLNHRIRKIDTNGIITTVAGTGHAGRGLDGVPATSSDLNSPAGIALDPKDDLLIVDWQNYAIRKVSFSAGPAITAGAVVNAASFTSAIAPGSLITIFGQSLASSTAAATTSTWPATLADATVQVNGANIPLYYVSAQQINAQLPFEIQPGPATLTVTNMLGVSSPVTFNVTPAAPGVFQDASKHAIALNQDSTLNSPSNPEARGRAVVLYLTGQGAVSPAVVSGQAAPLDPLSNAALPFTTTVGDKDAMVLFLGLAPGFIGLAQANIIIPADSPTGDVNVVIKIAGQPSNTVTISVR